MKKITFLGIVFIGLGFNLFAQAEDAWVYLKDKETVSDYISNPITMLTQKAIDRKNRYGVSIDERDVPVNDMYIAQLKNTTGITVLAKSKWFNAVHVRGIQSNIEALASFVFVNNIDFANDNLNRKSSNNDTKIVKTAHSKLENTFTTFNYGLAANQIEMFNGDALHRSDYTGAGMTVAVIDAGFPSVNTMASFKRLRDAGNLLGGYNFVKRDPDVFTSSSSKHGTWVLSDMAGFKQNEFVGTAPDASYYLFITEDEATENPVEESYWVEAVERADSLGVDVVNTSLGYTTFDNPNYSYLQADLDGNTAFITRGANLAFEKGLLLVNSAGNSGNGGVGAPADAEFVFSIGAVNAAGNYARFSSVGSNFQPSQKPDVVAQGEASYVIDTNDNLITINGTSFSSPILAGGITCLWQALPNKTNAEIMQIVRESSSQYTNPDFFLGYGIPNLELALNTALSVESNVAKTALSFYPNPVTDQLFVKGITGSDSVLLSIYDMLGKEIQTFSVSNSSNFIDLVSISKGIYILKLEGADVSQTFKLVKE